MGPVDSGNARSAWREVSRSLTCRSACEDAPSAADAESISVSIIVNYLISN